MDNNSLVNVLAPAEANKKGTVEKWQQDKQTEIQKACSGNTPFSCQTYLELLVMLELHLQKRELIRLFKSKLNRLSGEK
ncbi:hypothetical protein [Photorhabdus asymbiotica]|uniref:hypothetical protein n=1 Tax=Photorhabdus asymbiotica TaxID=291112 RepID=UPI003DA71AD1